MMPVQTNSQKMAQTAYQRILQRRPSREFVSFAREFPSLVHSCGLAQAIAFAKSKKQHHAKYLEDLAAVLSAIGHVGAASPDGLAGAAREDPVPSYVRLSRNALQAAGWLKRYVEAAEEG
jgi:CRISPR-associated protein Cmr5